MENTELLQSIINEAGIQTTHDAAVIAIHYALLSQGFILLGEVRIIVFIFILF